MNNNKLMKMQKWMMNRIRIHKLKMVKMNNQRNSRKMMKCNNRKEDNKWKTRENNQIRCNNKNRNNRIMIIKICHTHYHSRR